ncbi:MAG: FMN-binding protein [Treponema sp.]
MKLIKTYQLFILAFGVFCCVGCHSKAEHSSEEQTAVRYADGTYKAVSSVKDDWGGYAEATVTVIGGKITTCEFLSYEKDGTLKGEDYGKTDGVIKNAGLYKIAQDSMKKAAQYGPQLVDTQRLDKVDAIAGATTSYKLFQNAAGLALEQAKKTGN